MNKFIKTILLSFLIFHPGFSLAQTFGTGTIAETQNRKTTKNIGNTRLRETKDEIKK